MKKILTFIFITLLSNCSSNNSFIDELFNSYPNLKSRSIEFNADDYVVANNSNDSSLILPKKINIFKLIDISCSSCVNELSKFLELFANSRYRKETNLYIIGIESQNEEIDRFLGGLNISFPIYIDGNGKFWAKNDISNYGYMTYITDEKFEIKLIGDPYTNPIIGKYFRKIFK
jgi:hypothetical protein